MKLIIIRGVPGSGKTTFANNLLFSVNAGWFEADQYFIRNDGIYDFNPRLLKNAHEWCFKCVKEYIETANCIVSNTFTRKWEMLKYIELAREVGAELVVYRCVGRYKNIHGVPDNKVQEMLDRFEDFEGEIYV